MNTKTIRVLFVEDNKFDQMAFERLVDFDKLPYDYTLSSSKAETEEHLASKVFDVIIADYYLGDATAFDLMQAAADIPLIIITGLGDEDIAVKAMKEGAFDYLVKDVENNYLKVLPIVIEKAIKRKQVEEKYRMLSHALMCIHDSIYITDVNDTIIFVNKSFCKNYGFTDGEIIGQPSRILWKNDNQNAKDMKKVISEIDEYGWKSQVTHQRKDGTEFPIYLSRSIILDDKGQELAVVGVAHKINP
ncbi:MAG: PAS domain S-box protein [bacterium]